MGRLEFDLLFGWFVGLGMDDPVWDHSTFSNRSGLIFATRLTRVSGHAERLAALER